MRRIGVYRGGKIEMVRDRMMRPRKGFVHKATITNQFNPIGRRSDSSLCERGKARKLHVCRQQRSNTKSAP